MPAFSSLFLSSIKIADAGVQQCQLSIKKTIKTIKTHIRFIKCNFSQKESVGETNSQQIK